jgi:hypothetical protein
MENELIKDDLSRQKCSAIVEGGRPCRYPAIGTDGFCGVHHRQQAITESLRLVVEPASKFRDREQELQAVIACLEVMHLRGEDEHHAGILRIYKRDLSARTVEAHTESLAERAGTAPDTDTPTEAD